MKNIIIVLLLVSIGTLSYVLIRTKSKVTQYSIPTVEKLRVCPDAWIENRMPGPPQEVNKDRQYFIFDGERKEIDDYELNWIKENCDVKPQVVY